MRDLKDLMRTKLLYTFLVFITSMSTTAYAQEFESFYQNYFAHPFIMNVARAGANDQPEIVLDYHRSFAGFRNSPRLANIFYSGKLVDNIGIGAQIGSYQAGYYNTFRAQLNYSYKVQLNETKIFLGLGTAYHNRGLSSRALTNANIVQDDPLLAELADGLDFLDISMGVHLEWDQWRAGISLPNAIRARMDREEAIAGNENDYGSFNFVTAYVEYDWNLEAYNFTLTPSIYYRGGSYYLQSVSGEGQSSVDLNCLLSLDEDRLYGGLSYRIGGGENSAASILLGAKASEAINVFYTYRIGMSEFQRYNDGSHEISCLIQLKN